MIQLFLYLLQGFFAIVGVIATVAIVDYTYGRMLIVISIVDRQENLGELKFLHVLTGTMTMVCDDIRYLRARPPVMN